MSRALLVALAALSACAAPARDGRGASDGFAPIFDGESLAGWHPAAGTSAADWSARDGVIAGHSQSAGQSFLVFEDEGLGDFELELEIRLLTRANTGVEIRARRDPSGKRAFEGYHADIGYVGIGDHILGAWDFHFAARREHPCPRGTSLVIEADETPRSTPIDGALLASDVRGLGEWNRVRIVARGNRCRFFINGKLSSEFTDNAAAGRLDRGAIALQLHDRGDRVEFRGIRLKRF